MVSCREKVVNPNANLSLSDYASLDSSAYALSAGEVRRELRRMAGNDSDSTLSDFYARSYYLRHQPMVWVDRKGVDSRADTLVARLGEVRRIGFDPEKFRLSAIETDMERVRSLDFTGRGNGINKVYARLEYNLTKALFRFAAGQRFGYTNPNRLLNRLDRRDTETESYYTLYDLHSPSAGKSFYRYAVRMTRNDSLIELLDEGEPQGAYYQRLVSLLNSDSAVYYGRQLLLVNLERCRWRLDDYPSAHRKYVLVNIPSFRLRAVDGDDVMTMRIGCGSLKTKTPLLSSSIKRMDINPQWIMPRSIVKKSIVPRLGNAWYFRSRHYFIRDRATGAVIEPWQASPEALLSGAQLAIQEGGEGNALGRIIFRFDNDFSIYLHDTSSKDVFDRADRDVSHGCIRVQRPYDLAVFLLGNGDDKLKERIRYSMLADVSPVGKKTDELTEEQKAVADTLRRDMLVGSVKVRQPVPVFIVYFTLYPDFDGTLRSFADVYGYDSVIYNSLRNYI